MARTGRREASSESDVIVRGFIEGLDQQPTRALITQIEGRFRTRCEEEPAPVGDATVQLWTFPADQIGGRSLSYELFRLQGAPDRATLREARRKVDSIMAIVSASSALAPVTRRQLSEIVDDVMSMAPQARPLVTILVASEAANASGGDPAALMADLRLPDSFTVLSAEGPQGHLYCFGRITQIAVRRHDKREAKGLPGTRALGMAGLLGALEPDRDAAFAPSRRTMPLPPPVSGAAPPRPDEQPLAPPPKRTTGPTVVIGARPRSKVAEPTASVEDREGGASSTEPPNLRLVPPPPPDDDGPPEPVRFEPRRSRPVATGELSTAPARPTPPDPDHRTSPES
jgi:hypothetical protein